jgi:hypothetical protein
MAPPPDAPEHSGGLGSRVLMSNSCPEAVERYVRTGAYDSQHYTAFPGSDFLARARNAHAVLRGALRRGRTAPSPASGGANSGMT